MGNTNGSVTKDRCDHYEVEVTRAKVRRERMGHRVESLYHIWYFKSHPFS